MLIETLHEMRKEDVEEVSSRSLRLRFFIKAPMVLIISTSSAVSSLTIVMLKLITELIQSQDMTDHIGLTLLLIGLICVTGPGQLHLINLAMKYYDQMEVIPTYSTTTMSLWIVTGLIVFNEARFYSVQ